MLHSSNWDDSIQLERKRVAVIRSEHEFDVIVCAAGFDVSWKPSYPTIGHEGRSLSKEWADMPNTYLSITVPHFPNYLIFNGPYGPYGHGSFLPITETLSRHFLLMLTKMFKEGVTTFDVEESAVADVAQHRPPIPPLYSLVQSLPILVQARQSRRRDYDVARIEDSFLRDDEAAALGRLQFDIYDSESLRILGERVYS
ncbi:hypothetical protein BJX64DRAFT_283931 [Aspergillus heterothallicus]